MDALQPHPATFTEKLKAHIELLDPITWVGVLQGTICGAIASGGFTLTTENIGKFALLTLLLGPLGTGFAQSINDYYDRDLDRINDPVRPIPSGRISETESVWNWSITGLLSLIAGAVLALQLSGSRQLIMLGITLFGFVMGYIYSAPPLKLKRNVLTSAPVVGLTYSLMTWIAGNIIFTDLRPEVIWMGVINMFVAIGLIFLNDFKSVEGDRSAGLKSLPIMIGVRNTYLVSFAIIDVPLAGFALLMLTWWGFGWVFIFSLLSFAAILYMQLRLYLDPKDGALAWDNAIHNTGLRNVIAKSDVKEHRAFLRYLVVNNGLYVINVVIAAVLLASKPR
ncbi:MAG: UbiA family prenyltransferase [Rhizobacter sp.]|nr:UbiA family prenyltransferase [Chlorobiales bacterium]